ncbi:MAG: hypothetical protein D6692_12240 [Planctomycetota bacterium]|nr:MAG: hypothetical protein D6692_12240 [Planctomycetota bacterium]
MSDLELNDGRAGAIRPDPSTPDGRDMLISRVIDAEATGDDWRAFRAAAETDPSIWRDLAEAQEQHESLCEAFRASARVADAVELPELIGDTRPFQHRLDMVGRWGGWAVAAALLLVWATGFQGAVPGAGVQSAGLLPGTALAEATPDQALDRYLSAGRDAGLVVGEVPDRLVIEAVPLDDGTIEVMYLRQFIERRVTDRVFREARTDAGTTVPVPVSTQNLQRSKAF